MKRISPLLWIMNIALLFSPICKAATIVPCLIFSGSADSEYSIDLAKLNRITFGDNSMVISSKDDPNLSFELLYSLYDHLEIGDADPTNVAFSVKTVEDNVNFRIYFDPISKNLYLQTSPKEKFRIGIFNAGGQLVFVSEAYSENAVGLENLPTGVYVAVATDGNTIINHKFIIN